MKQIFTWVMALTMSLALFSCSEDRALETSLITEEILEDGAAKTSLYVATSEMEDYAISKEHEEDDLRASLLCKGYTSPTIDVSAKEFKAKAIKAYWTAVGTNQRTYGLVSKYLERFLSEDQAPKVNSLAMTKVGGKRKLKMYAQVRDGFNVKNKFAMLTLDGVLRSERYVDFKPNDSLRGLEPKARILGYHLPIMTDIKPFDKIFSSKETVHFRPRGLMIALNVINNNSCNAVRVKRIEFEADNALWFEGSFDTQIGVDSKGKEVNLLAANSSKLKTASFRAKFNGSNGDKVLAYEVYNGDTPGYDVNSERREAIDEAVKTAATKFYIWGYPRDKSKKLKIKIVYSNIGLDKEMEKECAVDLSKVNLQEGFVYQLPILLSSKDNVSVSLDFETPLDFVAEEPAINKAGTGFVKNHCLPTTDIVDNMLPTDVGYYSYGEANALFSKSFLKGYYLPTVDEWASIIPKHPKTSVFFNPYFTPNKAKVSIRERAKIGLDTGETYDSDFILKAENNKYITYAVRFKGTNWASAWRYSYEGATGNKKMIIKCVPLKETNAGKTLEQIANTDFFKKNKCTVRFFPAYGWRNSNTSAKSSLLGRYASYWSSSSTYKMYLAYSHSSVIQDHRNTGCAVRPFRRAPKELETFVKVEGNNITTIPDVADKTTIDLAYDEAYDIYITVQDRDVANVKASLSNSKLGWTIEEVVHNKPFQKKFKLKVSKNRAFKTNEVTIVLSNLRVFTVRQAAIPFKIFQGYINPLDFVSAYPALSEKIDGKERYDFVDDFSTKNPDVTFYNFDKTISKPTIVEIVYRDSPYIDVKVKKVLVDQIQIGSQTSSYFLASMEQWLSIIPNEEFNNLNLRKVKEFDVQIGYELKAKDYDSEFISANEGGRNVLYARRFIGTKWESAWRYSYEDYRCEGDECRGLVIKCISLKNRKGTTIDQIKNYKFFLDKEVTLRLFPAYGYLEEGEEFPEDVNQVGFYWPHKPAYLDEAVYLGFSEQSMFLTNEEDLAHLKFPIRCFQYPIWKNKLD